MIILAAAALASTACDRTAEVDAPPPAISADITDSVPPLAKSIVESEIRYDLDSALLAIERAVPRTFGDITKRIQAGGNKRAHVAFAAKRSPFVINVDGQRVTISSVIDYEGRGWYRPPIGPEVSAACGTGDVDGPRARIRVESTLRLTEQWALAANSRVARVVPYSDEPRDRCRVTLFRIDVTERVMNATRGVLEQQLSKLDRALGNINTRAHFEKWWRGMSRPIRLTDSIYFTINPNNVQLGRIEVDSGFAVAHLRLEATPRIQTGNRPNDFDFFKPLPPLRSAALSGEGFRIALEGEFGYDVANALLRKAVVGRRISQQGYTIRIRDVTLSGIGAGRVALGVRVDGSVKGHLYLTGTPSYDNAKDQLYVPDLSYDLATADLLVRGVEWLRGDWISAFLRERARFPVEGELDKLRQLAEKGMNRRLADGVELVASVEQAKNVSVFATKRALVVRADAFGDARLDINKPLKLKRMGPAPTKAPTKAPAKTTAAGEGTR